MAQPAASPKYALISPTFKRPDEVTEFLQSLTALDYPQSGFEIILGDGTPGMHCDQNWPLISDQLPLQIYYEEYLPVSDARNRAASLATAQYFIFLDSDCIIPPSYLRAIDAFLEAHPDTTLFGGPDAASSDFTDLQKAINFSMTSFLTTGGIRGGKSTLTSYQPRGFNMGMSAELFRYGRWLRRKLRLWRRCRAQPPPTKSGRHQPIHSRGLCVPQATRHAQAIPPPSLSLRRRPSLARQGTPWQP